MKVLLIICIIGYFASLIWESTTYEVTKRKQNTASRALLLLSIWGWAFIINETGRDDKNSKRWDIKTEIRTKVVNGVEIKRDTVYILTPKNKKK